MRNSISTAAAKICKILKIPEIPPFSLFFYSAKREIVNKL